MKHMVWCHGEEGGYKLSTESIEAEGRYKVVGDYRPVWLDLCVLCLSFAHLLLRCVGSTAAER
jgi:hypothetical protein